MASRTAAGTYATDGYAHSHRSGRFGHESTVSQADLEGAAFLFNCYGVSITGVEFIPD